MKDKSSIIRKKFSYLIKIVCLHSRFGNELDYNKQNKIVIKLKSDSGPDYKF